MMYTCLVLETNLGKNLIKGIKFRIAVETAISNSGILILVRRYIVLLDVAVNTRESFESLSGPKNQ